MATAFAASPRSGLSQPVLRWLVLGLVLACLAIAWVAISRTSGLAYLSHYPEHAVVPVESWINRLMEWLTHDLAFGSIQFKQITRGMAAALNGPNEALHILLLSGFNIDIGHSSIHVPALSWAGILVALVIGAYRIGRLRLTVLVACATVYIATFGQWHSTMITLASVLVVAPLSIVVGIAAGIVCYRHRVADKVMEPILDLMQTVPTFSYLVPVLVLFGFGPAAAMIATFIFATPPMVRVTSLALKSVPSDIIELGTMVGTTRLQLLWKVLLPSARYQLMIGVNQTVMFTLNMVIIASMIGSGGLGYDILVALQNLRIGDSIQSGVAISLIAVIIDRFLRAGIDRKRDGGYRPNPGHEHHGWLHAHRHVIAMVLALVGFTVAGIYVPALSVYPQSAVVSTAHWWDQGVAWINIHYGNDFIGIKYWALIHLMMPLEHFLLAIPWVIGVIGLLIASLRLSGWKLATLAMAFCTFVLLTGSWDKAMVSVYLTVFSVALALLIGMPLGIIASGNRAMHKLMDGVVDVLQTLPSFVYLIPAVMFFGVGDFAALIAIVAFAVAPAIRYTDHGIRGVSAETVEAGHVAGCSRLQLLWKIKLPLAAPEILLGVNQTIMMALSMLVIAALVGTTGLGQETYKALAQANTGHGLVAGLSITCIAMTADRIIRALIHRRMVRAQSGARGAETGGQVESGLVT